MKHSTLAVLTIGFLLASCKPVDTTGVNPQTTKVPEGNPNAAVVVQEYSDLECPACGAAYTLTVKPFLAKYKDKVRFEFVQFPLSIHEYAFEAAVASECAADQGKFWAFVDKDYINQKDLSSSQLRTWAGDLILNMDLFERCMNSGLKDKIVQNEYNGGIQKGVQGTPTFFVNGKVLESNTLDALTKAVDDALKGSGSMPL